MKNHYLFILLIVLTFILPSCQGGRKEILTKKEEASIHFNMGNEYFQMGKTDKAVDEWKKAVELEPENIPSINNM